MITSKYGVFIPGAQRFLEPADTIEEALELACDFVGGYGMGPLRIHVGECIFREPEVRASLVIEDEQYLSDENIDETFYLEYVTREQYDELEHDLTAVFRDWIQRHGLESKQYRLDEYVKYICFDDHWEEWPYKEV